jgi:hypothetical protein
MSAPMPDEGPPNANGAPEDAIHITKAETNDIRAAVKHDESDRYLMRWLRTGADYYRRLAHAAADAARKGRL